MAQPLHHQLVSQARRLARLDPKRPQQGNLRRAVSAAYYALFHYLIDRGTRVIIGTVNDRRPYRDILARSFDHGVMKRACKSFAGGALPRHLVTTLPPGWTVSPAIRQIAEVFVTTQETRHLADYDRATSFTRFDALSVIHDVEQVMTVFGSVSAHADSQFFLACLLTWDRLERRG